jgi:hypothetical protein
VQPPGPMRANWGLLTLAWALCLGCESGGPEEELPFDDEEFLSAVEELCGGGKCDSGTDWVSGRFATRGELPPTINVSWDAATLDRWSHQDQGVRSLPLSWALAVERPDSREPFFSEATTLRHGFLPDRKSAANPLGLPVGFTVRERDGRRSLGFTCAACHGAEVSVGGRAVRIAGGHGRQDFIGFADELAAAFRANLSRPDKAVRLLARIVRYEGLAATPEVAREIFEALRRSVEQARHTRDLYPVPAGPGRLDAAGRGANRVFGELVDERNYEPAVGPVSYPPLWDVPRFDWSHYNGAIRQNLARNTVEALGIGAELTVDDGGPRLLSSSVDFEALLWLEEATRALRSPGWPEAFGPLDTSLVAEGRALYGRHCGGCHGELGAGDRVLPFPSEFGEADAIGLRFFPLEEIGTDPTHAGEFARRTVLLTPALYRALGLPQGARVPAADAFAAATGGAGDVWFDARGIGVEERARLRAGRPNVWRAPRAYRARPLNGMWASAPFLHNGSVPSLVELLGPPGRRSVVFQVGSSELDPETLGFKGGPFKVDTRLPGNSNRGHTFEDRFDAGRPFTAQDGAVGPALSPREVRALVELMKALAPL